MDIDCAENRARTTEGNSQIVKDLDPKRTEISQMESVLAASQGDLLKDILKLPAPPRFHCRCDRFGSRGTVQNAHLSPFVRDPVP